MTRIWLTFVAAFANQYLFDFIKYVLIDPATTRGKQKTALVKCASTLTGFVVWWWMRGDDEGATVDDLFFSLTVGPISGLLYDASKIMRQAAIAMKKEIDT